MVCFGMDSTDKAFLRWLWKICAAREPKAGEEGTEAVAALMGFCPTIDAAEQDDSDLTWSGMVLRLIAVNGLE